MIPSASPLVGNLSGLALRCSRVWVPGLVLTLLLTVTWASAQTYTYSGNRTAMLQSNAPVGSFNTVVWNITGGYFNNNAGTPREYANTNLVFDNVALNNGYSTAITTFTSATTVTGSGPFSLTGPAKAHDFVFAGNMTGYTGNITIDALGGNRNAVLGDGNSSVVQFGGGTKALGTVTGASPDRFINHVAGSGSITANVLIFNYGTDASYDFLKVTNAMAQRDGIHFIGNANIEASGPISDAAGVSSGSAITKSGSGILILSGTNTYTGQHTVSAGTLQFAKTNSLYNSDNAKWTAANLNVKSGATLAFNVGGTGEFTTANVTTLLTNLAVSSSATSGMNGGSNFAFDTSNAAGGNFTINNVIANSTGGSGGARGLTKLGSNSLTLSGNNTYTGKTTVMEGTLQFAKTSSLYNGNTASWTAANLNVKSGATLGFNVGGTGEFTAANVTTLLTNLAVSSSATSGMNGGSNFAFDTSNAAGGNFTISDVIANSSGSAGGARGLTKLGSNTLSLTGSNTYTGVTTVSGGTLLINGNQSLATGPVNVAAGATLGGSGRIGGDTVINGGTHAPGLADSAGVLTHLGNVTYTGASKVAWQLTQNNSNNSLQPGPSYYFDQIKVDGNLDFAAATTMNLTFNSTGSTVDWDNAFWDMPTVIDWLVYDVSGTTSNFSNLSLSDPSTWLDKDGVSFNSAVGTALPNTANFYLYQSGNSIYLRYEAIPEPAGFGLLALALGVMTLLRRPRRRLVVSS